MAKATSNGKKTVTASKKTVTKKKNTSTALSIDQVNEQALEVLKKLQLNEKLQHDIAWCIGSFKHDQNPSGLIETAKRSFDVLTEAKTKNAKAVTAKLLTDLKKAFK